MKLPILHAGLVLLFAVSLTASAEPAAPTGVRAEERWVHFRPDIYQRDAAVLAALDGAFRVRKQDLVRGG